MVTQRGWLIPVWAVIVLSGGILLSAAPQRKQGLYSASDDVVILNTSIFFDQVLGKDHAWIVEFYNSWCGHCINFAPTWKKFATDIKGWRGVVRVGAVDCSVQDNLAVCRAYDINAFPTMKFFPPQATGNSSLETVSGATDNPSLVQATLAFLTDNRNYTTPASWPRLSDLRKLDHIWEEAKSHHQFVILVFEDDKSVIGRQVILDMMEDRQVLVRRMLKDNVAKFGIKQFPALFAINKDGTFKQLAQGTGKPEDRWRFVATIRSVLGSQAQQPGGALPQGGGYAPEGGEEEEEGGAADGAVETHQDQDGKPEKMAVHMQDLESALHYCLRQEVAIQKSIDGDRLDALKNFLRILAKHFPGRPQVGRFLWKVYSWLTTQESPISGQQWLQRLDLLQDQGAFLPSTVKWTGCLGSKPGFRGYPCGMWTLFHTLTVSSYLAGKDNNPQDVLLAVRGYMDSFFGCRHCRQHFHKMAVTVEAEVHKPQDAVLWLWRAHNSANKRLHGDLSEDPQHPKMQFPSPDLCPQCHTPGSSADQPKWHTWKVFKFLVDFYNSANFVADATSTWNSSSKSGQDGASQDLDRPLDWWESKQDRSDLDRMVRAQGSHGPAVRISARKELRRADEEHSGMVGLGKQLLGLTRFDIGFCMTFYVLCALCIVVMYYHFIVRRKWRPRSMIPY